MRMCDDGPLHQEESQNSNSGLWIPGCVFSYALKLSFLGKVIWSSWVLVIYILERKIRMQRKNVGGYAV